MLFFMASLVVRNLLWVSEQEEIDNASYKKKWNIRVASFLIDPELRAVSGFLVSAISEKINILENKDQKFHHWWVWEVDLVLLPGWCAGPHSQWMGPLIEGLWEQKSTLLPTGQAQGQIKPLSAVPSQEGMRSCSSHQPQGSCQLCPSGGCCHDKLPLKGASAQFLCFFHSRWAGRKQISSFQGRWLL